MGVGPCSVPCVWASTASVLCIRRWNYCSPRSCNVETDKNVCSLIGITYDIGLSEHAYKVITRFTGMERPLTWSSTFDSGSAFKYLKHKN